ncbi:PAS domain-containing protein [Allofournierella sp.]|uniref:PAS domain-containing protein n=1 Tax=Allofournierella sp. TaxID=1940256 RepID=UPI003AB3F854
MLQPSDPIRTPAAGGSPGGQQPSPFFPSPTLDRQELDRQLGARGWDILSKSIPGGMMGGYLEPGFPLYFVNDFMLSYLGYSYDEFVAAIGGKVINCMHPADRERVDRQVEEAFSRGAVYEVQYRMQKKDGSYIWVNDVGKKGLAEDGRGVCISVIRDISAERENRERLERQAAGQRRLAAGYDHLFQSVLCGIVQYTLSGRGVVFKKANREAIRIFGYEPDEFWQKSDWDLAALIAPEDRRRVLAGAATLHRVGDKSPYEYRLLQKSGAYCWIIGSAELLVNSEGEQVIQSVFLDIDERKKAEQRSLLLARQVEASSEVLHLALKGTSTCEFFYDPDARECRMPARTCRVYQCAGQYAGMPGSFASQQVDPAHRAAYCQAFERIHGGEAASSCEFRSLKSGLWCRQTLSVIHTGEGGAPRLVVGILEDITRQKEMEQALEEARSRDTLTGLYNRECGVQLIQQYLAGRAPGEHGVLMLLDMDDFEAINQREGSIFADALLQETAGLLCAETGPEDIQVRLGGDEFMLFLKHSNKAQATVTGPRIAALVQGILANAEKPLPVSVSIGMCSTEVVGDYNSLYRCAESTLKYVKEHCRGQAACYLDTSHEMGVFLTQLYTDEHPVNPIETEGSRRGEDLVSFALDLLGKAKNLNDAVFLLLSRIGRTFHFDRVSIIEANREYLTYRFSHQWARSRADLQLGQSFYVSEQDFELCTAMYDEDGLADHNLHEGISHIASCLHAGIWDYGEYVGSMSFEIDQPGYRWTPEQRRLLKELVGIVPSFIMKSKADALSKAKTDFLSRMSHEIRTPMNAISGMTTIAQSVAGDRAKTLDCLQKIESANAYLLSLINDILDMSRIESGKLELHCEAVDLAQLLGDLEALFRAQALEKGLALRFENGRAANAPLLADRLRLNQVLVNIIGNAVKFTDQGGVTVRVDELGAQPNAVALRFSVSDTGVGIEPAAQGRIFNAFEQADAGTAARRGGTGLGLSISSRLVQMMGGTLEVHSQPGKGSEFFFTLTLGCAPAGPAPAPAAPCPVPRRDFTGCTILLAEDNELNREIGQTILQMNGFTVVCATDGREALELFCGSPAGRFGAILMDIRMPVMDGLEATRRIRTSGRPDARTVPIIALTANAFDEDSKKSIASGMNGHLSKPVQVDRLLELLAESLPLGPAVT